jgi:glycosyltransferase involved in cell wall biosynthesis
MPRADLHVHTKYSYHASEWFLQRLGANESYTDPEDIRHLADLHGMDYFTVTDHNSFGSAPRLMERYPDRFIPGVESTAYFPEDRTKVHILIYGLNEMQFIEIQRIRENIYDLRDYIRENELTCSVAHATYSINGLTVQHLEKLILLFDVFESVNGGRNRLHNQTWTQLLKGLRPEHIDDLRGKYGIDPFGVDPWIKGFTGGSDDHAGLFVGKTWTGAEGKTVKEFLTSIRSRRSFGEGRYNDFTGLAFTVYKVAYDFSRTKSQGISNSPLSQLAGYVFENRKLGFFDRLKVERMKSGGESVADSIKRSLAGLIETLNLNGNGDIEEKLQLVYERVIEMSDILFGSFLSDLERHIRDVDIYKLIKDLTSSMYGIFLTVPFFSAFAHMYRNRHLLEELKGRYGTILNGNGKKVLWFTDTLTDLNGVSMTLKTIGWMSARYNKDVRIVTCLSQEKENDGLPPNILNIPHVHSFKLPYYESYDIRIPSILDALKKIYREDPDEIFISTPGPVGLLGLLAARLLGVKSVGIYHTDFTLEAEEITDSRELCRHIEHYVNWFYSAVQEILVPTREYIEILEKRGIEPDRMKIFPRGIDTESFLPIQAERDSNGKCLHLLYVGRISKDKNLDFLMDVYDELRIDSEDLDLTVVGDGPYLEEMQEQFRRRPDIRFTGALSYDQLPEVYSKSDLFLFPSKTDTFGMVVLEAQACGLPAVVSDIGGPKEIIVHSETGYVARSDDLSDWVTKARIILDNTRLQHEKHLRMKQAARVMVEQDYSWAKKLSMLLDEKMENLSYGGPVKPAA